MSSIATMSSYWAKQDRLNKGYINKIKTLNKYYCLNPNTFYFFG